MAVSVGGARVRRQGARRRADAPDYDESRALFNAMIDKRPPRSRTAWTRRTSPRRCATPRTTACGSPCAAAATTAEARRGRRRARDRPLADERHQVDAAAKMARVEGGALLKDVLEATHEHGLTVPVGIIGTTGVGGLTLGGGIGHLTRGVRAHDRQPRGRDRRARGRLDRPDGRRARAGPVLGAARRRRQLRRRHVVLVPLPSRSPGARRAGAVRHRRRRPRSWRWYRDSCRQRRTSQRLLRLPLHSAGAAVPRGAAPPQGVRRRAGRRPARRSPRRSARHARSARRCSTAIAPMPMPAWNTAFDGVYPPGDQWYWRGEFVEEISDDGDRRPRRSSHDSDADVEVDDAPVRDRRRRLACRQRRDGVGVPGREAGRR